MKNSSVPRVSADQAEALSAAIRARLVLLQTNPSELCKNTKSLSQDSLRTMLDPGRVTSVKVSTVDKVAILLQDLAEKPTQNPFSGSTMQALLEWYANIPAEQKEALAKKHVPRTRKYLLDKDIGVTKELRDAIFTRIQACRKQWGVSLEEVGGQLDYTRERIRQIEKGKSAAQANLSLQSPSLLMVIKALGWEVENATAIIDSEPEKPEWITTLESRKKPVTPPLADYSAEDQAPYGQMIKRLRKIKGWSQAKLEAESDVAAGNVGLLERGEYFSRKMFHKVIVGLGIQLLSERDTLEAALIREYMQEEPGSIITDPHTHGAEKEGNYALRKPLVGIASSILRAHYAKKVDELISYAPPCNKRKSGKILYDLENVKNTGSKFSDAMYVTLLIAYFNCDKHMAPERQLFQDPSVTPNMVALATKMNALPEDASIPRDFETMYLLDEASKEFIKMAQKKKPEIRRNKPEVDNINTLTGIHHPKSANTTLQGIPIEAGNGFLR